MRRLSSAQREEDPASGERREPISPCPAGLLFQMRLKPAGQGEIGSLLPLSPARSGLCIGCKEGTDFPSATPLASCWKSKPCGQGEIGSLLATDAESASRPTRRKVDSPLGARREPISPQLRGLLLVWKSKPRGRGEISCLACFQSQKGREEAQKVRTSRAFFLPFWLQRFQKASSDVGGSLLKAPKAGRKGRKFKFAGGGENPQ